MTFLPIVEREMRVASRRSATYWRRFATAASAVVIGFFLMLANRNESSNEMGMELLVALSILMFIGVMIAGTQATADCISEEKREGTLGLLFLTDLKGYDVVFGKLAGTAVALFYDLFSLVPILAIPMLLGGVTWGEFARVVMVEVNLLLLSVTSGILCSAVSKGGVQASIRSILLVFLLIATAPVLVFIAAMNNHDWEALMVTSPGTACYLAFEVNYQTEPAHFWISSAITLCLAGIFFGLACRIVPRCWHEALPKPGSAPGESENVKKSNWTERAKHLNENPYLWRALRSSQRWLCWAGFFLIGIVWLWGQRSAIKYGVELDSHVNLLAALGMHLLLKLWLTIEACRCLGEDRRVGAMELLLSTPLDENGIVAGQRLALFRLALPLVMTVLGMDIFLMLSGGDEFSTKFYIISLILLFADLYVLSWVGPWLSLKARSTSAAVRGVVFRIIVAPTIGIVMFIILLRSGEAGTICVLWLMVGAATDLLYFGLAEELPRRFREMVHG